MIAAAHSALEESISLADRLGDENRMLTAATEFGAPALWGSREWGQSDPHLTGLLERQLNRIADTDQERRVRILSTLASELSRDPDADRGWAYANDALEAARQLGGPAELSIAVSAYLLVARATDHLQEHRALLDEMLRHEQDLTLPAQALLRTNLLTERIETGQLLLFDAEFPAAWRLAADLLHSPELQAQLRFGQACRYLASGDVALGTRIAERTFHELANLTSTWQQPAQFILDTCVLLVTGKLADHAEEMAAQLVRAQHPSLPHLAAPAALGFAQRGEARRAAAIVSRWFEPPPRSWVRIQAIAYWA
jgi:hypothetical protein